MCPPCLLGSRNGPGDGVVQEVRILAQPPPQPEPLASIVALVYEVALGRVGAVGGLEGGGGALPGLCLEAAVLAQAKLDAVAQAAEEGGLVGGRPAEAWGTAVAIDAGGCGGVGAEGIALLVGHVGKREKREDWVCRVL